MEGLLFSGAEDRGTDNTQGRLRTPRWFGAVGILFLFFAPGGCGRSSTEAITLNFIDPEWRYGMGMRYPISDATLQEFTRETGIRVNHLPTPEGSKDQLAMARKLLQQGAAAPDVYGIDTIWPGMLGDYFIDLKPYLSPELSSEDPTVVEDFMVGDRLVAMPYHQNTGALYYRTDLLERYGYRNPPRTWDELEKMAVRIQKGERARGEQDFWGFVWPGAPGEGLLCNALEWQVDQGGGRIIERDKRISVNNPHVIHAWKRAAHWLGWISPPAAISFGESDATNVFWISGKAAFVRGWADYVLSLPPDLPFRDEIGVTSVPGGNSARVGTLGGAALAIPRTSAHRAEAIKLVEFLIRREPQIRLARIHSEWSRRPESYELPRLLVEENPRLAKPGEAPGASIVVRPSTVAGKAYDDVSQAYILALHSVLSGKSKAPDAATRLEKELVRITGFEVESNSETSDPVADFTVFDLSCRRRRSVCEREAGRISHRSVVPAKIMSCEGNQCG